MIPENIRTIAWTAFGNSEDKWERKSADPPIWNQQQSLHQALTGKIYHLKQQFLLPAMAWRFTKINKVDFKKRKLWPTNLILTRKMNKYIWKGIKIYTPFFMSHAFWKENIEDRVKFLESNILNCYLKITKANLCKNRP